MGAFGVEGTRTVSVNGAGLAYLEAGRGEPVVFVHGGYSDLRRRSKVRRTLARALTEDKADLESDNYAG